MSDIFISYKREEQAIARKLANALESEGWTVWWDPKLRAGEHFDDAIEKALSEAKSVIVMWSERSVQSRYVRDEATYALALDKLVPVSIENVNLPFKFQGIHTLNLLGWDGSRDASEFRKLVDDISSKLEARRKAEEEERRRIQEEPDRLSQENSRVGVRSAPTGERSKHDRSAYKSAVGSSAPSTCIVGDTVHLVIDETGLVGEIGALRRVAHCLLSTRWPGQVRIRHLEYEKMAPELNQLLSASH